MAVYQIVQQPDGGLLRRRGQIESSDTSCLANVLGDPANLKSRRRFDNLVTMVGAGNMIESLRGVFQSVFPVTLVNGGFEMFDTEIICTHPP